MIFGTTVRNKRHGAEDGSGQDCMGGYTRWPEAYLVTLADDVFGYELQFLVSLSGVLPVFQNLTY